MVLFLHSMKTHRKIHLVILSWFLLVSSIQVRYSAEGRPSFVLLEIAKEGEGEEMTMEGAMIGSRPPTCEGMCSSCGHCEAVQVPAAPQDRTMVVDSSTQINSRGDDSSNYKPLSWKCKCGSLILNP